MNKADSPTKTCTHPDCDHPLRARGLCATHYNQQHQPNRHAKVEVPCACCGVMCIKDVANTRAKRFCSLLCRDFDQYGPLSCRLPIPKRIAIPKPEPFREERECAWCGKTFTATRLASINCSLRCKHKAARNRRIGREAGAIGSFTCAEVMRLFITFNRCCAYCEQPVDGQPDPDHVVPLSRGGENRISNILPSCKRCNGDKRDLLLSEWNADRTRRGLPLRRTVWDTDDQRLWHLTCISPSA